GARRLPGGDVHRLPRPDRRLPDLPALVPPRDRPRRRDQGLTGPGCRPPRVRPGTRPDETWCEWTWPGSTASGGETLAHALGDRRHLDLRASHVAEELVGGRALAERPQLAQELARLTAREPLVAELGAEEVAQLRLERP